MHGPHGDLFASPASGQAEPFAPGGVLLRGWALGQDRVLLAAVEPIMAAAPLRHWHTPGGRAMSVASTNAGALGWVSDARGYRYTTHDPHSGQPWPTMPTALYQLAQEAAAQAGYPGFAPDAALVNVYTPGTQMGLHQDRDERDFSQPIVSLSLGLPAVFLWGSATRSGRTLRLPLLHGDVLVWGGPTRLHFHGIAKLPDGVHPLLGPRRINVTFRKAS